jgi:hypothetical protein
MRSLRRNARYLPEIALPLIHKDQHLEIARGSIGFQAMTFAVRRDWRRAASKLSSFIASASLLEMQLSKKNFTRRVSAFQNRLPRGSRESGSR